MRRYETIFISDPDIPGNQREDLYERVKNLISQQNGFLIEFDEWGTRKLAYEIKKKMVGHYIRLDYCGPASLVSEMERSFRIDDSVLKFMTILLDDKADLEELKEEAARKKESLAEAEKQAAANSETSPSESPMENATEKSAATDEPNETVTGEEQ